jgi:hypothetical protein
MEGVFRLHERQEIRETKRGGKERERKKEIDRER